MTAVEASDCAIESLDSLARSIDDNARDERLLARRIRRLSACRAKGRSWQQVMSDEPNPSTLELASGVLNRFTRLSGELRRTLARSLRAQGVSIAAIAEQFGVSRQRVSALLHRDRSER
jgi:CRP-like cAMP-binding protein